MSYKVDFKSVSSVGLETSSFAEKLAGLRANEARYFMNKYQLDFYTKPASTNEDVVNWVNTILSTERDIQISATPLEIAIVEVDNINWTFVFYNSGLAINVLYTLNDKKKRAVGFKLSEGMEIPLELKNKFKFANQRSKLAGTIRGSFFVIKGEYL